MILDFVHTDLEVTDMKIKEIYKIFRFLRKSKSCLILKDDFQLGFFGETDEKMMKFNEEILKISIKK